MIRDFLKTAWRLICTPVDPDIVRIDADVSDAAIERAARALGNYIVADSPGKFELDYPWLTCDDANAAFDLPSAARAVLSVTINDHSSDELERAGADMRRALARFDSEDADLKCWKICELLRADEGDSVTLLCDNPDGAPNNAVECCGFWTSFEPRRFEGDTILEALTKAQDAIAAHRSQ